MLFFHSFLLYPKIFGIWNNLFSVRENAEMFQAYKIKHSLGTRKEGIVGMSEDRD